MASLRFSKPEAKCQGRRLHGRTFICRLVFFVRRDGSAANYLALAWLADTYNHTWFRRGIGFEFNTLAGTHNSWAADIRLFSRKFRIEKGGNIYD